MDIKTIIICLIAGVLGQIFHMGIRIVKLAKRAKAGNAPFSVKQYLIDDKWPELLNLLGLLIVVFLLPDLNKKYPGIMEWTRFAFITFGYMGSSLLSAALSKAETKINSIINEKTDKADGLN